MRLSLVTGWSLLTTGAVLLSLLVAAKDVAIGILFVTCGLGMPLLLGPTFAAYLICLGPAALTWSGPYAWVGQATSAIAVLGLALLPARWSAAEAAADVARLTADDRVAAPAVLPRTLEIVRPSAEDANLDGSIFGSDVCGPACRALLLGGEVEWIRIVTVPWSGPGRPVPEEGRLRLVRATGAGCDAPDAPAGPDAACVIFAPDVSDPAELVLEFEDGTGGPETPYVGAGWARPAGWRRVTATVGGGATLALRRSHLRHTVVHVPTLIVARLQGMSSGGVELSRALRRHGEVTLDGVLRDLGYPLAQLDAERGRAATKSKPMAGPPDEETTRRVVSILDLPADVPFAPAQQQQLSNWMAAARTWSHRGGHAWPLDQLVERTPALAAAVLPDVIARTEALGLPRDVPWLQAWYGLARTDPSVLHPHADRIAALVDAHPDPLVVLSGRLGVDPTRWLVPLDRPEDPNGLERRLRGACRAEARWSPVLVGPLRDQLDRLDPGHASSRDLAEVAARALVRHGDPDGARERLVARGEKGERVWQRVASDLKRQGAGDAICR